MTNLSKELLDQIVQRLVEALHPVGIYLFGSHARGGGEHDSDIDLLVVVRETDVLPRELARRGRRSLWGLCVPVDLIVCTASEMEKWSKVECNLLHTVAQEGRAVYAAEE